MSRIKIKKRKKVGDNYCFDCEKEIKEGTLKEAVDEDGDLTLECPHCGYQMGGSWGFEFES